ncbi:MAG: GGDEF domain-containing protein, partial [Armatimonadota bacterium]
MRDTDTYRKVTGNLVGSFQSHQITFFAWEVICVAIALAIGYLFEREVSHRQKAEEQANIDGLTGVYNHRFFQERLAAEVDRASRFRRVVSLISNRQTIRTLRGVCCWFILSPLLSVW